LLIQNRKAGVATPRLFVWAADMFPLFVGALTSRRNAVKDDRRIYCKTKRFCSC
jgi:hypothetical protein